MSKTTKKDIVFTQVIKIVFRLEYTQGHLNWTVTQLSKIADVSRNSIYQYLGKNKEEILKTSFTLFYKDILMLDQRTSHLALPDRLINAREKIWINPGAIGFYYNHALGNKQYQDIINDIEFQFMEKLKSCFPDCSKMTIVSLRVLILGLIKYQELNESLIRSILENFMQLNLNQSRDLEET